MSEEERYIVHVDMDAFFASIEQRDNPQYKGKPVVIGADPKSGIGRGVVSTCSYEARKFGIHSAMPISIAYRKCPTCIFLPVNMEKYIKVSEEIFELLQEFTPIIEKWGIDEAFLDISNTYKKFMTPYNTCVLIKKKIKEKTGLTVSVGLAPTKIAAKIASDFQKPDGLTEIKKENLLEFLWKQDVEKLLGVGKKTKEILNNIGIITIGDLAKCDKFKLEKIFGKNGLYFWEIAQGIDESKVETGEKEIKSLSTQFTFEQDTDDKVLIKKKLSELCNDLIEILRADKIKFRTITLKIRLEGFQTYTRAFSFNECTDSYEILNKCINQIFDSFETKGKKVRLVGVRISNLLKSIPK